MSDAPPLRFERLPAVFPLYLRALLSWRRRAPTPATAIPTLEASAAPVPVDNAHLLRFCRLVGHRRPELLPLTYPQVLAAPLQLALLASRQFPLSPGGIVHVSNRIVLHRPVQATEALALTVSLGAHDSGRRGRELKLDTAASDAAGQCVWQARAILLARYATARGARPARASAETEPPSSDEIASFPVPADSGRRYARISGDYNPIHLSALTARLFGFRQPIAHGMWSLARVLGALSEANAPQQVDVRFRRPLSMPAEVALYLLRDQPAKFSLCDRNSRKIYLTGTLSKPT